MTWAEILSNAGQYGSVPGLCVFGLIAYGRGWVVSSAQHKRELAAKDEICEYYKETASTERETARIERQRADTATAALTKLAVDLPDALRQLGKAA